MTLFHFLISLAALAIVVVPMSGLMYFMARDVYGASKPKLDGSGGPVLACIVLVFIVVPVIAFLVSP